MKAKLYKIIAILLASIGLAGSVYLTTNADVPTTAPSPGHRPTQQKPCPPKKERTTPKPTPPKQPPKQKPCPPKVEKPKPKPKPSPKPVPKKETPKPVVKEVEKPISNQAQSQTNMQTNTQTQNNDQRQDVDVDVSQNVSQTCPPSAPCPEKRELVVEKAATVPVARPVETTTQTQAPAVLPETGLGNSAGVLALSGSSVIGSIAAWAGSKKALKKATKK